MSTDCEGHLLCSCEMCVEIWSNYSKNRNMKKSAYEVWKLAKEQNLNEEETKELMIKEGIIIEKSKWINVEESLPNDEVNVLCYHSHSENYFICYRTRDCITNKPKWFGGSMPTHWKYLDKP